MVEIVVSRLTDILNALTIVMPGDKVRIRGGIYQPVNAVAFERSGIQGNPITFEAYDTEKVVFDGALATEASLGGGWEPPLLYVGLEGQSNGNWLVLKNIEVRNSPGEGVHLYGSDNICDHIESHHNRGSGFDTSGNRNNFFDCDGHDNVDPQSTPYPGGDADGFGTQTGSKGNYFLRCKAYRNSDDGFDCWQSTDNILEKCVSHDNGQLQGGARGFAGIDGGNNEYKKCIAYNNPNGGFEPSNTPNNNLDHCTAFNNGAYEFVVFNETAATNVFSNNIGRLQWWDAEPIQRNNSWNLGITDPGFISTDPTSPDFLSLRSDSPSRRAGSDGSDIGALQFGEKIADLFGPPTPPPVLYVLDVWAVEGGTTTPTGRNSYPSGTPVSITATAQSGYVFDGWLVNNQPYAQNPLTLNITDNLSVMPIFNLAPTPPPPTQAGASVTAIIIVGALAGSVLALAALTRPHARVRRRR